MLEPFFAGMLAALLLLGVLLLIIRFLLRRCHVYAYVGEEGRKVLVRVGLVARDGTILDVTRPRGRQRVGQVYMREGRGYLRLYQLELGDDQYEEVGYVDPEGNICSVDGAVLSRISPQGRRHWWDLFLRLHAEVPEGSESPFGYCIEVGRFRHRRPNEITLLARGGAALLLYYKWARKDETPRLAPHIMWDTALPAAFLFTVLFLIPGMTDYVEAHHWVLPLLGREWSYVATGVAIYLMIWLLLHFIKVTWLSANNEAPAYLTLLNRQTGIQRWGLIGWWLSVLGVLGGIYMDPSLKVHLPVFLATFAGFTAAYWIAPDHPWAVRLRSRAERLRRDPPPEATEGNVLREYRWQLDAPFKNLLLSTEVRFQEGDIEKIRRENPYFQDWEDAMINSRRVTEMLVREGEKAPQAQQVAGYIKEFAQQNSLTVFEEIQAALDFVQEPNIAYALDEDCEEIGNAKEYFRFPAETLYDKRGDCDCKTVLAAALMRNMGYPVLLLISPRAAHAALAVGGAPEAPGEGLYFMEHEGEWYYFCETTGDGWKVGQPSEQANLMLTDRQARIDLSD